MASDWLIANLDTVIADTALLTDWLADRPTDRSTDQPTNRLTKSLCACLNIRLTVLLTLWVDGQLLFWLLVALMVLYLLKCDFKLELRKIYSVKTGEVTCHLLFLKKKSWKTWSCFYQHSACLFYFQHLCIILITQEVLYQHGSSTGLQRFVLMNLYAVNFTFGFHCCACYFVAFYKKLEMSESKSKHQICT